ncbi:MAG TPA: hypothetical protein VND91_00765, partial [Candidatus Saccharimonadia bacterium]|nr:hypothetical protein [Candidatus Saccharimonadia bacterium]
FPAQGYATVAFNLALVLASNGVVLWLLLSGRLRSAHLIMLVIVETLLLIAIARGAQRLVPRRDLSEQPKPWREVRGVLAFALCWIGFAYALTLVVVQGWGDFIALLRSRSAWTQAGLHWPLLLTLATALVHAAGDLSHYRRHGGPFLSSVSHDAMARYLTLLLGGIPFAMPFFAVAIGGFKGIELLQKRFRAAPATSVLWVLATIAIAFASFGMISLLVASGVNGWAIGYVFAKLIAEACVACIPLVMAHVAREGE